MISACIITIGDELLIGQVTDTNSAWMGQELVKAGIWVKRRMAVGDSSADIRSALDMAGAESEIVLVTGGLGPTADDITKPVLCDYFGGRLVMDQQVLDHVQYLFEQVFRRPGPLLERNRKQAEVPDNCTVLHNAVGTAPGMWFEKDGRVYVSMPGVPHEMKYLMGNEVLPRLNARFTLAAIAHRTLLTAGIGESMIAERIKDFESHLPGFIRLAYLPNYGMVRLRLTATGSDRAAVEEAVDAQFDQLKRLVADVLVTDADEPLELAVGKLLLASNKTMATAESCTGGYIAHLITTHPGSSSYFLGSVVSYANSVKENLLQVPHQTLLADGAVSEATVTQMVKGVLMATQADYALATSGIMGPDGGTQDKPVGMVWIAAGNSEKTVTRLLQLRFDRLRNIEITAVNALNLLRQLILKNG